MLKENIGFGHCAGDSAGLELARDPSKLFYNHMYKGIRVTAGHMTGFVALPSWGESLEKEHTNSTRG